MAEPSVRPLCELRRLGLVRYKVAWDRQAELVRARKAGEIPDQLLLLEHPHVYTLGRRGETAHILLDAQGLAERGIEVFEVDRGGDVTYHGPGQLVGYPIVDLRRQGVDAHRYVRGLEETLIQALAEYGVAAGRNPGYTGVWLGEEKIAAIGVRISGGVTSHGFALNVNTDLSYFAGIVPCGIVGKGVTSLARVLGRPVPLGEVAAAVARRFAAVFELEIVEAGALTVPSPKGSPGADRFQ
ncbi:MAG: lipoyl(octanoyl) transferase LipB [Chloroflexi bacterium]|nr:lipoyl(octanoyl) transferase LipB [Chloroflexota bacterium]MDA8216351.1 lipoyl(octanoyl) transferase LipB [Dehalococcoidales bacterium]